MNSYFAILSRMKYISRWALMRNMVPENIAEHSLEVSFLAHAMATLGNLRLGKDLDADRAAVLGMFHDTTEILTGDMPTPVKYNDASIRGAYQRIEDQAAESLLNMLPADLQSVYRTMYEPLPGEEYLCRIVKAADKLSALIKCMEEEKAGNKEFSSACQSIYSKLLEMPLEELHIFMDEFLPSYRLTLDELQLPQ